MAMDATCTICLGVYDTHQRRPYDLGCGHCTCEECYNQHGSTKLSQCPECRRPVENAHLQWAMLRLLERSSVKSFPIGAPADEDGEPTPPASPVAERSAAATRPWSSEDLSTPSSSSSPSPSAPCLTTLAATAATTTSSSMQPPAPATSRYPSLRLLTRQSSKSSSNVPAAAAATAGTIASGTLSSTAAGGAGAGAAAGAGPSSRQGYCPSPEPSTCSASSQQRLVSYPVLEEDDFAAGFESDSSQHHHSSSSSNSRATRVPWQVPGWVEHMSQLVVAGKMDSTQPHAGWPLCGSSVTWAAISSWQRCCGACCTTFRVCLALHAHGQHLLLQRLEQGLRRARLPGSGQDAATWLLTVALGVLAYHWAAGLLLLPLLAAALLAAFFVLLPASRDGHTLLPFKSAGVLLAGYSGLAVVALAGVPGTPVVTAALQRSVMQLAPHCMGLLGLLLLTQVAAEAWERGAANESEAAFLLLVLRGVLLAGAAWGGRLTAAAALAPHLQKAFLCHQCGALVRTLQVLVAKHYGSAGAVMPLGAEPPPTADHGLLLLLLTAVGLYLPPGAVAPSIWMPWPVQALLVWAFRVVACGYTMRTGMGLMWRTAEAAALPYMVLPDKSILMQLLKSYWPVLAPLLLVTAGDTFLCAAAPMARGALQRMASCCLTGLLGLELGQLLMAEGRQVQQLLQAAARRQASG